MRFSVAKNDSKAAAAFRQHEFGGGERAVLN